MKADLRFLQYTPDFISGTMSLREPQRISLEILAKILQAVPPEKGIDLKDALQKVHGLYPTCTDFEREFLSLSFALATGVGKTRLMGAFITYLYTRYGLKNFFVVAPNITIYNKLHSDLSQSSSPKYVFKGLACFSWPPVIYHDDDYRDKNGDISFGDSISIYIYNISKFDSETANMRRLNERRGESFIDYMAGLPDLVLIMDESHHYRAKAGMQALNDLKPVLGLELTATPLVSGKGGRQEKFRNVVYEFPLSAAIEAGYTRTPYAMTRSNIESFGFGEEELDRAMIDDGIRHHEKVKAHLAAYASNNDARLVKPFAMVVCKNTDHARSVYDYVTSDDFRQGRYKEKTLLIHSKQGAAAKAENIALLADVERADNPIEIVIHVDMLKEGWDVNNLYTIIPLRTAASRILREQMVGRGLRLPYGERTGDRMADMVMLTAHDNFAELVREAQSGESIFRRGNLIEADKLPEEKPSPQQMPLFQPKPEDLSEAHRKLGIQQETDETRKAIQAVSAAAQKAVQSKMKEKKSADLETKDKQDISKKVIEEIKAKEDYGAVFERNQDAFAAFTAFVAEQTEAYTAKTKERFIPIPQLAITSTGGGEYIFDAFDLDLTEFRHTPLSTELIRQNLVDARDAERDASSKIAFAAERPVNCIVQILREKPVIDYEQCGELVVRLVQSVCRHYTEQHGYEDMRNIVMMYRQDIAGKIYRQMMQHFHKTEEMFSYDIVKVKDFNMPQELFGGPELDVFSPDAKADGIRSVVFTGIEKGVFDRAKFDSLPELTFARICEQDGKVLRWLRPAPSDFDLKYGRGHSYEPDFVVETADKCYLVEVKGEDKLNDAGVLAKKELGMRYCQTATAVCRELHYKPWEYVFIPSKQVQPTSSLEYLCGQFACHG
ncbi:MAG: DEAD/DEAH box helicase family protein [Selenomonadaceae bacterium]|nr:DEAD/DEAH box helicase family protein [Selenomonadaceae bacterium]